ncbi:uncharacterized protein LOC113858218 [Abrus precatorius]|uniref:Uncharacterized protein LOC113858218 n=1 Tax=Abrus precatorius TaxID=3816 RepID=A0A8B8KRS6_ABRPR|nr:uncharacterized protein LOC113858218 [Abrus precatorius]
MGTRNLVMLKTHIDSINLCFPNVFVYENVLWVLTSLWVLFCNYVLYSLGLILRYIFRFQVEDRKHERLVLLATGDQTKRNQSEDSDVDGLTQELGNLLFLTSENFLVASEEREGETEFSDSVEIDSQSDNHQHAKKREEETDCSVLEEKDYEEHEEGKKRGETEESVFTENILKDGEDIEKIDKDEADSSVFLDDDSYFLHDDKKKLEEEEKIEDSFFTDTHSDATSGLVEEPRTMIFTFLQNYKVANVSDDAFSSTENICKRELSEHNLEQGLVSQREEEEEHSVQEQRTSTSSSTFGGSGLSDDNYFLYDNSLSSDLGSESFNTNFDDSVTRQIRGSKHSSEGFDSESLKTIKDERVEDTEETQFSCDSEVSHSLNFHLDVDNGGEEEEGFNLEETKETTWEDNSDESEFDEEDEDDYEWEHDELVEQLKLELKNARQGGLATILEEEDEELGSPKVVEDLKPLIFEEKIKYKDHILEIQKVYRSYAEKIRKLDVLNYQTMHAIGLLQLKDPLNLMLVPKYTVQSAKPQISQNLWPRKAPKHISDPILKIVDELHRDLELVYVGQVCLSWEILCWQHKKVEELKQYDSQWPRRYNLVAGEFQLFQVLMQRFLEDEPFQGPRIQNYVKNRCVIRNLLQVPAIKDDNTKDKKIIKWGEEDAIDSERLTEIIKESMRVFWEFVKADKDYGNMILKSHRTEIDVKDPAILDLLGNVRTHLQKKERKLKDIVRSGNCLVRKFQKHHEDHIQLGHEQLLAQVGLKLVSRLVQMKKLRKEQLLWCDEKLNQIKFVGRKIHVESSFLLFPC